MIARIVSLAAVAIITLNSVQAVAQERPIPEEEWTAEARHNLVRCLVGEAGWSAPDHAAIPWALSRSWAARVRGGYELTFATQVARYCAALRVAEPTPRQRWVRALPAEGPMTEENEPEEFPDMLEWAGYTERLDRIRTFVDTWARGEVRDPCPRADHWGGTMDSIGTGARLVCPRTSGGMHNTFFYIDPEVRRALTRARIARRRAEEEGGSVSADIASGAVVARRRRAEIEIDPD